MANPRRAITWRAAWLVAVAVLMVLWRLAAGNPEGIVQIEFGMHPDVFVGAEVVVDGEVVGTLERLGSRTLNGFRVGEGLRTVSLRKEGFLAEPVTVDVGSFGAGSGRLLAGLEDRYRSGAWEQVLVLR